MRAEAGATRLESWPDAGRVVGLVPWAAALCVYAAVSTCPAAAGASEVAADAGGAEVPAPAEVSAVAAPACVTPAQANNGEQALGEGLKRAWALSADGEPERARAQLAALAAQTSAETTGRPRSVLAGVDLGIALLALDGPHVAAPVLSEALRSARARLAEAAVPGPERVELTVAAAAAMAGLGQRDVALALLRGCEPTVPKAVPCDVGRVSAALEALGDVRRAAAILDAELSRPGMATADRMVARLRLASRADTREAHLALARAARAAFPGDVRMVDALAGALVRAEAFAEAMTLLEGLLLEHPTHPGLLARISAALDRMQAVEGQDEGGPAGWEALRRGYLDRAAADPNDGVAAWIAALVELRRGALDRAEPRLSWLAQRLPAQAAVPVAQAMVRLWLGDSDGAARLARRAVELEPRYAPAWWCVARVHRERAPADAEAALKRHLALATRPGVLNWPARLEEARADLAALHRSEIPSRPDDPRKRGGRLTADSLSDPKPLPPPPLFFGGLSVLCVSAALGWWWRRRAGGS